MNRLIIIGNGFDKAHGLKTAYKDFIDNYWDEVGLSIFNGYKRWQSDTYGVINLPNPYNDEFISFKLIPGKQSTVPINIPKFCKDGDPYGELCKFINCCNDAKDFPYTLYLSFKNQFFKHISERCYLDSWLGIENEFYGKLKGLLKEEDATERNIQVKQLNADLTAIKDLLEKYLENIVATTPIEKQSPIQDALNSLIELCEVSCGKRKLFFDSIINNIVRFDNKDDVLEDQKDDPEYLLCRNRDEENRYYVMKRLKDNILKKVHLTPDNTLVLNFNYTQTAKKLYTAKKIEFINIHGELKSETNPVIFGYGDELDDYYKDIEKLQDNDFLENIKSVKYHETSNYRRMLSFIEAEPYQVFIMGHSCGNSDRTLLNTLFEHRNCISIKVFYHQIDENSDDYSNLVRNISRNFNDKQSLRDLVVNHKISNPLTPLAVIKDELPVT